MLRSITDELSNFRKVLRVCYIHTLNCDMTGCCLDLIRQTFKSGCFTSTIDA